MGLRVEIPQQARFEIRSSCSSSVPSHFGSGRLIPSSSPESTLHSASAALILSQTPSATPSSLWLLLGYHFYVSRGFHMHPNYELQSGKRFRASAFKPARNISWLLFSRAPWRSYPSSIPNPFPMPCRARFRARVRDPYFASASIIQR